MIKDDYIKVLGEKQDDFLREGMIGLQIESLQEWINLQNDFPMRVTIDGDFGPQTERTVKAYQTLHALEVDGIVGPETWNHLTRYMRAAFDINKVAAAFGINEGSGIRALIVATAHHHLSFHPRELNGKNEGPWVRAYMGGHDGSPWAWCVGSPLTWIDQALSMGYDMKFTDLLPDTYSCDKLGSHAKKTDRLIRNAKLKDMSYAELTAAVKPGDLLLKVKTPTDWTHCAMIVDVEDDHFLTIEGNTNDEGSREGYEVCKRVRSFHRQNIDVVQLKVD